ncbi:MAG: helix-turn-helix domain-containing protein, partial [Nitrospira sp.]
MSSELILNNKKYIPVKDASLLTGYSKDYVGRLCREGQVVSTRIGKAWYVEEDSILSYKNSPTTFNFLSNLKGKKVDAENEVSSVKNTPVLPETLAVKSPVKT